MYKLNGKKIRPNIEERPRILQVSKVLTRYEEVTKVRLCRKKG